MTKAFKRNLCFFIALLITVISACVLPYMSKLSPEKLNKVQVKGGQVDASKFDIDSGETVFLTGEWEFYWNKLLVSENADSTLPDLYATVPSSWTSYDLGEGKLHNSGCASYRLLISNINAIEPLLISLPNMPGAYSVYIDKKLVFSNCGNVENIRNVQTDMQMYASQIVLNNSGSSTHEVIIEVSCDYSSGITVMPQLCSYKQYQARTFTAIALRYLVIGIVIFFAAMALLFSVMMKNKIKLSWLIVLCISFVIRMLISNEGYMVSHTLFFDMNYEIMTTLVFVSTYIIKLSMFMHIATVLEMKIQQATIVFISAMFLICAFVPYFLYEEIYIATTYMWLQSVPYLLDAYMIYKLSDSLVKKIRFSGLYLVAYCITASGIVIDNFYSNGYIAENVSFVMPAVCVLFIVITIYIHSVKTAEAYSAARHTAELSKELSEVNMTLMLSQIQPHFLYNALNTIKYLTKKDPKTAEFAIVKFSSYLRANMDSLTQKEPIPFAKELEHVQNYASIEKLRFGERLEVLYDIRCDDFKLPPLTVQPIVENAIKHGVNQRADGGTVTVSSYEDDKSWYVSVKDNGIGFEAKSGDTDEHAHIGINNIKIRLKEMLSASVSVASVPGEGTNVIIEIPKTERNRIQ